jgi:glutaredoxin
VMRLLLLALLVWLAAPAAGQIYKWEDEDGNVHYSSRPATDAPAEDVTRRVHSTGNFVELETVDTALTGNTITMLSTTWCNVCKKAKAWLSARGIAYTELDVEHDEDGKKLYQELNGKGVPIILVGKQRMNGFGEARMQQMLQAAGLI